MSKFFIMLVSAFTFLSIAVPSTTHAENFVFATQVKKGNLYVDTDSIQVEPEGFISFRVQNNESDTEPEVWWIWPDEKHMNDKNFWHFRIDEKQGWMYFGRYKFIYDVADVVMSYVL